MEPLQPLAWLIKTVQSRFSEPVTSPYLDSDNYAQYLTSRGFTYNYYHNSPAKGKPCLVFLHGFPCTSYDWRHQILFFQKQGYGLIVPDMLGFGGTDKPTMPEHYKSSLICADIIEIMNHENIGKAIVVGHDWGCRIASRLANYYPERFIAFAFLAVPYMPPQPNFNLHQMLEASKKALGYELTGYWVFMAQEGADRMIEANFDSFFSLAWPADPELWKTDMAPLGGLKAWLLAKKTGPLPPYLTEEDRKLMKQSLLRGGFAGPVNWYRVMTTNISAEDDKKLPQENYTVPHPVFFGGATRDYVCISASAKASIGKHCPNVTVREFDADHWLILSVPGQVCRELWHWITEIEGEKWVGDNTEMVVNLETPRAERPDPMSPRISSPPSPMLSPAPRSPVVDDALRAERIKARVQQLRIDGMRVSAKDAADQLSPTATPRSEPATPKEKKHKRDMTEEERRERRERKERRRKERERRRASEGGIEMTEVGNLSVGEQSAG